MNKPGAISLALLFAMSEGAGAAPSPAPSPAATVYVAPGGTFTVTLNANVSTGYGWQVVLPKDASVTQVSLVDVAADTHGQPPRVGAPGQQVFTFKATAHPKPMALRFAYKRPWEKDVAPVATYDLKVQPTRATDAATHESSFYRVSAHQVFTLSLPTNPSTGHSWKPALGRTDKAVLELAGQAYHDPAPPKPGAPPLLGAPGTQVFTFKAVGVGATSLQLDYSGPGTQPVRSHHVGVTVVK